MEKYEFPLVIFTVLSQMSDAAHTARETGKQAPVLAGKRAGSGGCFRGGGIAPGASGSRLQCPD